MKQILISIKPEWVAKILNGEKTLEIRKTMPKCDLPIDVYIYCTKDKHQELCWFDEFGYRQTMINHIHNLPTCNGKVVAKFTLNKVDEHHVLPTERILPFNWNVEQKLEQLCLTKEEVMAYENGEDYQAFLWHISNLEIFDKPKELSEFKTIHKYKTCDTCPHFADDNYLYCNKCEEKRPLTKAPQSWCYCGVEE